MISQNDRINATQSTYLTPHPWTDAAESPRRRRDTGALYRRDYCQPQAAFATVCEEGISEQVLQSMVVSSLTGMVVDVCNLLVTRKKDLEIAKIGEIRSTLGTVRNYDCICMEKAS